MSVRTTVHIDESLVERARQFVAPRGFNRLVNEALAEKVEALERERLIAELKEGYQASGLGDDVDADWEAVSTENWPA